MRVLVTGGAGYIGSHAVRRLLAGGHDVTVLDNLSRGHKAAILPGVEFAQLDLRDVEGVAALLRRREIEAVMHFAAYALVGESVTEPLLYYDNNTWGSTCLLSAMAKAGVKPTDVQYINAHGTSTPLNDKFETMAYKRVFGDHAPKLKISSTKGAIGHLLGAAGGVDAAICCKVLQTGSIPPTINYDTPDPDCDLDYVPNEKYVSETPIEVAVSDNLGFGGHNAALVFKRYPPA